MKKPSVELFELIHSLTMAEKKYFKMFSSLQGGDKSYLQLYDIIEKQRAYDEYAIRNACRGQKFLQYLAVAKRGLHNNILRSLEIYHHSSAGINLRRQISKADILLRKGLTAQALKLLKTAKLIAYQNEQWELLMEILIRERIPYTALDMLKMLHLNEEIETVLKKLNNINDYRKLHHKITEKIHKAEPIRTKKELSLIAKLMRHPLLRNSKQASCTEARTYYYEIWSRYYLLNRDFVQGYKTSKEQCEFIETHLHQLSDPEKRHLVALNISVVFLGYLLPSLTESDTHKSPRTRQSHQTNHSKYLEMQEVLKKIRNYPAISGSLKAEFWTSSYTNELNAFMQMGDFEKVFPALKAIEENEHMLNQASTVAKTNLCYNIAYTLFDAGNYNDALHWIRKIIDQPMNELRKDVQAASRILFLLIHYELHTEDEQMLDSLKRSTLNFLSTRQRLFKVEKALMHCLHQIMGKAIGRKERSAAFHTLKITLLKLMKNPMEKVAMDEFDFMSWVESKIQNKTFAEVVREKVK